ASHSTDSYITTRLQWKTTSYSRGAERRTNVTRNRVFRRFLAMVLQFDEIPRELTVREKEVPKYGAWTTEEIQSDLKMVAIMFHDSILKNLLRVIL
ncbi:hypothetical protein V3C99_016848, partial [Haemonchus contortus]